MLLHNMCSSCYTFCHIWWRGTNCNVFITHFCVILCAALWHLPPVQHPGGGRQEQQQLLEAFDLIREPTDGRLDSLPLFVARRICKIKSRWHNQQVISICWLLCIWLLFLGHCQNATHGQTAAPAPTSCQQSMY